MNKEALINYKREVEAELLANILPFWTNKISDEAYGGFYGYINNNQVINKHAPKAAVLNTRLLWVFSRAYSFFKEDIYLKQAHRAYRYICEHFIDVEFGGVYWELNFKGQPVERNKQIYAQSFAIYALTEYYLATGLEEALGLARSIFKLIEEHSYDNQHDGYIDTCNRDWLPARKMLINTSKNGRAKKSMNTQLHVLEAYSNLLRCWDNAELRECLKKLVMVFKTKIFNPDNCHFRLYFTSDWQTLDNRISYGHDIEGSWLLTEAADLLGEQALSAEINRLALRMAERTKAEGISAAGGILNEGNSQRKIKDDYDWWSQAEAMVGFLNAYEKSGNEEYIGLAIKSWEFIKKYFIDRVNGEWFWRINSNLTVSNEQEKVGPWKCPYHNSRACWEIITRVGRIINA